MIIKSIIKLLSSTTKTITKLWLMINKTINSILSQAKISNISFSRTPWIKIRMKIYSSHHPRITEATSKCRRIIKTTLCWKTTKIVQIVYSKHLITMSRKALKRPQRKRRKTILSNSPNSIQRAAPKPSSSSAKRLSSDRTNSWEATKNPSSVTASRTSIFRIRQNMRPLWKQKW